MEARQTAAQLGAGPHADNPLELYLVDSRIGAGSGITITS